MSDHANDQLTQAVQQALLVEFGPGDYVIRHPEVFAARCTFKVMQVLAKQTPQPYPATTNGKVTDCHRTGGVEHHNFAAAQRVCYCGGRTR